MSKVLLVDDDSELAGLLCDYLVADGFAADTAGDGESGVHAALAGDYDIVVLDVMMPVLDGIQALRLIRAASNVPVVMLTARGDDIDRISGLESGADDYVPKPCTPRELAARLRAILRRQSAGAMAREQGDAQLTIGDLVIRPRERAATRNGAPLTLTSTEFSLIEVLARNAGRVVSKAELSQEALGRPLSRFDRSIDVHMSSIRQKLGLRADGRSFIQTVIRKGYQLLA
ncbi:MAG: response regulator transcription factor [Rhodocyclaceae bacterium]|nr:response regulator transcription factor [Rhodocyclaceae bacterium]